MNACACVCVCVHAQVQSKSVPVTAASDFKKFLCDVTGHHSKNKEEERGR